MNECTFKLDCKSNKNDQERTFPYYFFLKLRKFSSKFRKMKRREFFPNWGYYKMIRIDPIEPRVNVEQRQNIS